MKFDEAVDDQGTNLVPKIDPADISATFTEFQNNFFRQTAEERKKWPHPWADLSLAPAARSAKTIARLRGTLNVSSRGTIHTFENSGFVTTGRQKMDIPAAAGIEITLRVRPGSKTPSIDANITGDQNALVSVELVTSNGQTLSVGVSTMAGKRQSITKQFDLQRPLDDSLKIVAKIATDCKITPVKFDLKDVPLP